MKIKDIFSTLGIKNFSIIKNLSLVRNIDIAKSLELFQGLKILRGFNGAQVKLSDDGSCWQVVNIINGKGEYVNFGLSNVKFKSLVEVVNFLAGILFCKKLTLQPNFLFFDEDNYLILCAVESDRRLLTFVSPSLKKKRYGKTSMRIINDDSEVRILPTGNSVEWWQRYEKNFSGVSGLPIVLEK